MNNRLASRLQDYIYDSESNTFPEIYLIHYVDSDGNCLEVKEIEWFQEEHCYLFHFNDLEQTQLWSDEIHEENIFVYKLIDWI